MLDAARVLLAEGVDPATPIAMRHAGANHDALRSTVGAAAGLTVKDGSTGRPGFRKHHAQDGAAGVAAVSPMRLEPAGVHT
jgi:hypothetical protein